MSKMMKPLQRGLLRLPLFFRNVCFGTACLILVCYYSVGAESNPARDEAIGIDASNRVMDAWRIEREKILRDLSIPDLELSEVAQERFKRIYPQFTKTLTSKSQVDFFRKAMKIYEPLFDQQRLLLQRQSILKQQDRMRIAASVPPSLDGLSSEIKELKAIIGYEFKSFVPPNNFDESIRAEIYRIKKHQDALDLKLRTIEMSISNVEFVLQQIHTKQILQR